MMIAPWLIWLLGVPVSVACGYLGILTVLSSGLPLPPAAQRRWRFDVIIPAHNERDLIAATVASARALHWPTQDFRVIVVADNCSDETAQLARDAGALVRERRDDRLRGKGYALAFAFERSVAEAWAQALVVVDADTVVDAGLLSAFAARLEAGSSAIQSRYGISNPLASWRTRLMSVALGAFHDVRSRARARLGVSCGIRGNGWCVTPHALQAAPYTAFTLAEDLEYGIDLALGAIRVDYVDEAGVQGQMVTSGAAAAKQRQRWEGGRLALLRSRLPGLVKALRGTGAAVAADLILDLLTPPLGLLVMAWLVFAALVVAGERADATVTPLMAVLLLDGCALASYVLRGWQLSRTGWAGLSALAFAPFFLVWKLALMFRRRSSEWIRTQREPS